jgi:hypothetical protein
MQSATNDLDRRCGELTAYAWAAALTPLPLLWLLFSVGAPAHHWDDKSLLHPCQEDQNPTGDKKTASSTLTGACWPCTSSVLVPCCSQKTSLILKPIP